MAIVLLACHRSVLFVFVIPAAPTTIDSVRGAAVNDRKQSDLSMWEYLANIGNRYEVAKMATKETYKETSKLLLCINPTPVCIEEWMCV